MSWYNYLFGKTEQPPKSKYEVDLYRIVYLHDQVPVEIISAINNHGQYNITLCDYDHTYWVMYNVNTITKEFSLFETEYTNDPPVMVCKMEDNSFGIIRKPLKNWNTTDPILVRITSQQ